MKDQINYINNSVANDNATGNHSFFRSRKDPGAMNVFIVNVPVPFDPDEDPFVVAGYYSRAEDFIVINKDNIGDDNFTLEHEIGHFFTLSHTHRGFENLPYSPERYGDTVTINAISSGQTGTIGVELVDGSNCGNLGWDNPLAGDGLCDTPPDYGFGQGCNCCFMQWDVWDRNGDKIEPMINNVMSYSSFCSNWNFSAQQTVAVQTSYDSNRRSYLRNGTVSDYQPINETVLLLEPANTATVDTYNGVELFWDPVENVEEYIITIDGTITAEYRTSGTGIYLTDLHPNGNYLWSVEATNKFGSGCLATEGRLFFTGNSTTSVNDLEAINGLNIFPNPVESGRDLHLSFNSEKGFNAQLRLITIDGKTVEELNDVRISQGNNKINLPISNGITGLHFIELSNAEGIKIQKVIIE